MPDSRQWWSPHRWWSDKRQYDPSHLVPVLVGGIALAVSLLLWLFW